MSAGDQLDVVVVGERIPAGLQADRLSKPWKIIIGTIRRLEEEIRKTVKKRALYRGPD